MSVKWRIAVSIAQMGILGLCVIARQALLTELVAGFGVGWAARHFAQGDTRNAEP